MYHIAEAMVRWLAPISSFTADEAWSFLPGERSESVFLETWHDGLSAMPGGKEDRDFWGSVMRVRSAVSKQLEAMRKQGAIGSSLDAEVDLYGDAQLMAALDRLGGELRFVLITSEARVHAGVEVPASAQASELDGLFVEAHPSRLKKCPRCWHHRPDVGADKAHPDLCGRCVANVAGGGEPRQFA